MDRTRALMDRILLTALFCGALLLGGAGATTQDLQPTPGAGPALSNAQRELFALTDPVVDGATVEVIESKLSNTMKLAAESLRPGGALSLPELPLAEEFLCAPLRPEKVQTIEVGPGRTVQRNLGRAPAPTDPGSEGLRKNLEELRAPFEEAAPLDRIASKVVYLGRGEGSDWIALVRVQFAQDQPEVAREQVAQWICRLRWIQPEASAEGGAEEVLRGGRLEWLDLKLSSFQEIVRRPGGPLFVDQSTELFTGLPAFEDQFRYGLDDWCERMDARLGISLLGHEGLALGDVNADGRDDLYVLEPGGLPNRLLVSKADGSFDDVSQQAGLDFLDPSRSALIVDLDADGDQDLAMVVGGDLLMFSNESADEGLRFRLRARLPAPSFFSLSAVDLENDGDLDLYACAYALPYAEESTPIPYHDANNGSPNVLYRNEGGWRFVDVTAALGLDVANRRFSFAAAWEDYDLDGDQDLYVANDFGRNALYRNDLDSEGVFTEIAAQARVEDLSAGMGVD
ncbi:MAG: VCBS repeat-containing protein, partial [Planctomycetota bacterium]